LRTLRHPSPLARALPAALAFVLVLVTSYLLRVFDLASTWIPVCRHRRSAMGDGRWAMGGMSRGPRPTHQRQHQRLRAPAPSTQQLQLPSSQGALSGNPCFTVSLLHCIFCVAHQAAAHRHRSPTSMPPDSSLRLALVAAMLHHA
jgi:hypothetical protein